VLILWVSHKSHITSTWGARYVGLVLLEAWVTSGDSDGEWAGGGRRQRRVQDSDEVCTRCSSCGSRAAITTTFASSPHYPCYSHTPPPVHIRHEMRPSGSRFVPSMHSRMPTWVCHCHLVTAQTASMPSLLCARAPLCILGTKQDLLALVLCLICTYKFLLLDCCCHPLVAK
jgi:hypothetical protein